MIVSWNWLNDYVKAPVTAQQAAEKLMMSGLNLESIEPFGQDDAIDLEVTSNRADCLGHIGVARELSALYLTPLSIPEANITPIDAPTSSLIAVENHAPGHCPHYQARVMRGVKVGPSPEWLKSRLECIGLRAVNNVVDVTNYVLMETGQPLHAFDYARIQGQKIQVRLAQKGEKFQAIDGKMYELDDETCVIADAQQPVAIAGVMGGKDSEVTGQTTDLVIETAQFAPLSVRRTARKLSLFSDSSFRFERGINLEQLDWVSRRCCELIQQVAGGEILSDPICLPAIELPPAVEVTLRYGKVAELLGIPVDHDTIRSILVALGLEERSHDGNAASYRIPRWRADLTREVDLIEEVARIYGYEHIRDDAPPQVTAAAPAAFDRTCEKIHDVLNAGGYYEAMTLTFTSTELAELINPRQVEPLLRVEHSSRKKENVLRPSLLPSLLVSQRANERVGNNDSRLYEIARVFTGLHERGAAQTMMLGLVTGQSFLELKGILETLVQRVNRCAQVTVKSSVISGLSAETSAELHLNNQLWGWIGQTSDRLNEVVGLKQKTFVAEVEFEPLMQMLDTAPQLKLIPAFPAIERDFNFLIDEPVTWHALVETMQQAGGEWLESLEFAGEYRGESLGVGKKTYLARASFRSAERTLTGEEVDKIHKQVVTACEKSLSAVLR